MRLPTPSSCLLDGVEGDVYGFDKACFGSLLLGAAHFLVCYCDASCSYRAFAPPAGLRACSCDVDLGQRCNAVPRRCRDTCGSRCAPTKDSLQPCTAHATMNDDAEMHDAPARPRLKRPLSSDGVGSLPSKLFAATLAGSPSPSPRHRVVSLAGIKRSRSGDDDLPSKRQLKEEAQERRRQLLAAPLPAPDVYAPEPPTRAPTPAPEPTVPATWLDLMRSLQTDGASPYPLPPRARRPPR